MDGIAKKCTLAVVANESQQQQTEMVASTSSNDGHSLEMKNFPAGGIEILIDECAPVTNDIEVEGSSTWEVLDDVIAGNVSLSSSMLGDVITKTVKSPSTPHPYTMSPPPPLGEPPSLLRNKRPHGLFEDLSPTRNSPQTDTCPCVGASHASASAIDVGGLLPALACPIQSLDTCPHVESSASAPSSSSSGSSMQSSPREEESVSAGILSTPASAFHSSVLAVPEVMDCQSEAPEMPPGPPPAKMAPPPPAGPPPDLPLDRAELKRTVEDSGSSPLGKRLRSVSSGQSIAKDGDGVVHHSSGDSTSSSSDVEDNPVVELGKSDSLPRSMQEEGEDGVESSYKQSPASARWVWDRFLQHDKQLASAQMLEKRMLRAMESLHMGSSQKSEDD